MLDHHFSIHLFNIYGSHCTPWYNLLLSWIGGPGTNQVGWYYSKLVNPNAQVLCARIWGSSTSIIDLGYVAIAALGVPDLEALLAFLGLSS